MKVQVNNITTKTIKNWEAFLKSHPHNTVFQSYDMYMFYKKVQNFEPFLFLCEDDDANCVGVLLAVKIKEGKGLKGVLSSRVVIYGGPIIEQMGRIRMEILDSLLSKLLTELKNNSIFIQFRNFFEWSSDEKKVFSNYGFSFKQRLNLLVDTSNIEGVLKNIKATKKRQISKALKEGARIESPSSLDEVKIFYDLLHTLYKNKVRKPLPAWSFFKEFYHQSVEGKLGIIRLIKFNHNIIGGILCPLTKGKNIYEWYVVGLDTEYKNVYPSVLATWAPIDYALNNNLKHFDFMGLGKPEIPYGVRDFKMNFGKTTLNFGRFGRRHKVLYPFIEISYNLLRAIKI